MFTEAICWPPGAESVKTTRLPSGRIRGVRAELRDSQRHEDRLGVGLFIANDEQQLRAAARFAVGVPAAVGRVRGIELVYLHVRVQELSRPVGQVEPHERNAIRNVVRGEDDFLAALTKRGCELERAVVGEPAGFIGEPKWFRGVHR